MPSALGLSGNRAFPGRQMRVNHGRSMGIVGGIAPLGWSQVYCRPVGGGGFFGLAKALAKTGDKDGARKTIEAGLKAVPENTPLRKEMEQLLSSL